MHTFAAAEQRYSIQRSGHRGLDEHCDTVMRQQARLLPDYPELDGQHFPNVHVTTQVIYSSDTVDMSSDMVDMSSNTVDMSPDVDDMSSDTDDM